MALEATRRYHCMRPLRLEPRTGAALTIRVDGRRQGRNESRISRRKKKKKRGATAPPKR